MELLQHLKDVTVLLNQLEPNIVEIVSSNPQVQDKSIFSFYFFFFFWWVSEWVGEWVGG